jgi:glycosyltransferase involved in cell wall biosynthesis
MGLHRGISQMTKDSLAVIETHPIQYHAPVYRVLQQQFGIPVTVIYGSDFSVAGYRDQEFGQTVAWDTDLLAGYESIFLSRVSTGGAQSVEKVTTRGLAKALRKAAPAAVLVVGYNLQFHRAAFYRAWQAEYPILFRGETTDHAVSRSALKAWARENVLERLYQRCARLLYVGQRSYEHFKHLGCPEDKLVFSPYCVDAGSFQCDEAARSHYRPAIRQSLKIDHGQKVLLFSGKLSQRKGPDMLLRAIKAMPAETRKRIAVMFMGNGELKESLERLAQTPPEVKIHFVGFQNQTQLSQYYHAADLLVLPSLQSETWGLVVNEALHHGLPCVVSAGVGCAPDLIVPGVTGEIFQTGSIHSLGFVIQQALALTCRTSIRERCRRKVNEYSIEKAAEGIAAAFAAMVDSGGIDAAAGAWQPAVQE